MSYSMEQYAEAGAYLTSCFSDGEIWNLDTGRTGNTTYKKCRRCGRVFNPSTRPANRIMYRHVVERECILKQEQLELL